MAKGKKGDKNLKSEFGGYKDEESRKRAIEDLRRQFDEKRKIEDKNYKLNIRKIQTRWREIMKLAKKDELTKQLEILQQVNHRKIDGKNAQLKNLRKYMQEAEGQFSRALQSHLMNIDILLDLQNSRLESLKSQFSTDLATIETEFNSERIKIQSDHAKDRSDILGIMARADHEFQENETDAKNEYSSIKDDVKNKNLEEKHALRIQLEGTVEDLWRQFQSALNQYNSSTEERKKQFEELKFKDQKNAKEIEMQMKKLIKLQENIAQLRTKMSNNAKDYEERNVALKEEKDAIQTQFQALKKRMNTFRERERQRLVDLTLLSNGVVKKLNQKVDMAERIIKLAEMNRKLETEFEKVLPFYEQKESSPDKTGPGPELNLELPAEFDGMGQFSKRFNKVLLDKTALDRQHESLNLENMRLRAILKQYLDGISVSDSVMNQLNPLLVVNGKTNAPLHRSGPVHITYVEGSIMKTY